MYEPIFCNYLRRNIELNNLQDKVRAICKGIGLMDGSMEVNVDTSVLEASGMEIGKKKIEVVSILKVIGTSNVDIAKFDCETCEYFLIAVPCNILRRIPEYIIEYHGTPTPIIHKFKECGFKVKRINKHSGIFGIGLLHFRRLN
mgnify:CR=1 FL=1